MTEDFELKNIFPDDFEEFLIKVESSFNISFDSNELDHLVTFRELCDHIANKIQLENVDNCSSQQAFYKLRDAIYLTLQIQKDTITTDLPLAKILPRITRRSLLIKLETHLGIKLSILRPPLWVTRILLVIFLVSVVLLFFSWQYGLLGVLIAFLGLWVAKLIGNELEVETVGQLAEKLTRENYLKSRRNPNTFNKKEIEKVLASWFD